MPNKHMIQTNRDNLGFFGITYSTTQSFKSLGFSHSWKPSRTCREQLCAAPGPGGLSQQAQRIQLLRYFTQTVHWMVFCRRSTRKQFCRWKGTFHLYWKISTREHFDPSFALKDFCPYNQCNSHTVFHLWGCTMKWPREHNQQHTAKEGTIQPYFFGFLLCIYERRWYSGEGDLALSNRCPKSLKKNAQSGICNIISWAIIPEFKLYAFELYAFISHRFRAIWFNYEFDCFFCRI